MQAEVWITIALFRCCFIADLVFMIFAPLIGTTKTLQRTDFLLTDSGHVLFAPHTGMRWFLRLHSLTAGDPAGDAKLPSQNRFARFSIPEYRSQTFFHTRGRKWFESRCNACSIYLPKSSEESVCRFCRLSAKHRHPHFWDWYRAASRIRFSGLLSHHPNAARDRYKDSGSLSLITELFINPIPGKRIDFFARITARMRNFGTCSKTSRVALYFCYRLCIVIDPVRTHCFWVSAPAYCRHLGICASVFSCSCFARMSKKYQRYRQC